MEVKASSFRVSRKATVSLMSDIITCSSPVTAIIASDNLSDYESILRQVTRDGVIISVEFEELDGAVVEEVSAEDSLFYEFEESDISDIKESFRIR